jgi:hypothetical protein
MACNDFFGRPPLSDLAAQVLPVRFFIANPEEENHDPCAE